MAQVKWTEKDDETLTSFILKRENNIFSSSEYDELLKIFPNRSIGALRQRILRIRVILTDQGLLKPSLSRKKEPAAFTKNLATDSLKDSSKFSGIGQAILETVIDFRIEEFTREFRKKHPDLMNAVHLHDASYRHCKAPLWKDKVDLANMFVCGKPTVGSTRKTTDPLVRCYCPEHANRFVTMSIKSKRKIEYA